MPTNNFRGPDRRTYYDMNPWYSKNKEDGIDDWHQHVVEADKILRENILEYIKINRPKKVLEIGCGGGDFTLSYTDSSFYHVAFEYSSVAIEMAKKKSNPTGVVFKEGDALKIESYSDSPFDVIIAKDVLHCILGEDRLSFLRNMKHSLSSKGKILLTTHVGLPESNESVMKYVNVETRENHLSTRIYLDKEDIEKEFIQSGLKIVSDLALPFHLQYYVLESI